MTIEAIYTEALALPAEQRAKLAGQLLNSLHTEPMPDAPPPGVPVPGRCKGMLMIHSEDDEHLKDFTEYMP